MVLSQEQPKDLSLFGKSPSQGRKRRVGKKSRSKKKASTSPVKSIDFRDYFEEIGLGPEETMVEAPSSAKEGGYRAR